MIIATQAAPQGSEGGKTPEQKQAVLEANNSFGGTIGRLLSLQENYPQLRSNEAFLNVQTELAGTENRINKSRNDFNDAVQDYNTTIKRFPRNFIAGMFGFREKGYFTSAPGTDRVPEIQFQ